MFFKKSNKKYSKEEYFSTDSAERLFWRSWLKLSPFISLKFLNNISLSFIFENCNLNTDKTSSWKSESLASVLKNLFELFVKIWFMQIGLFVFL